MLQPTTVASLESVLRAYEQKTTREVVVITLTTVEDPRSYATDLFHACGFGKKGADNGVLLLWVPQKRFVRIEVGYGLEGILPDGRAGEILREVVFPKLKANQVDDAISTGVAAILQQLDREPVATKAAPNAKEDEPFFWLFAVGLVIFVGCIVGLLFWIYGGGDDEPEAPRNSFDDETQFTTPAVIAMTSSSRVVHASMDTTKEPERRRRDEDDSYRSSSDSWSSPSSDSGGGGGFDFGGGNSGGGGADGSY